MFDKTFATIDAADILALITNQVPEGKRLDYKEQFAIQNDNEKKEFLSDISAFANTDGGHIIFGIQEQRDQATNRPTGIPTAAPGLAGFNSDAEILRLDAMIRDGLSPRLSGVLMKKVDGFPQGPVFIIRIPQSWNAPHMVSYQSRPLFHGRGNAGKYPLDISQIRSAFTFSESLSEKIRGFHQDRVSKILGGMTPVQMEDRRKAIFHLIPLSAFRGDIAIDVNTMREHETRLAPISSHGYNSKVNLEGMVFYFSAATGGSSFSYAQIYRNGIIEFVDSTILGIHDRPIIPTTDFEQNTIQGVGRYLQFLSAAGVAGPGVFFGTLTGVKGFGMGVTRQFDFPGMAPRQIDRDILTLPEVMVDDFSSPADVVLKPIFDAVYNAAGWDRCVNYDANGRWQFPRN